jgi:AcrR family transcriptional regulator
MASTVERTEHGQLRRERRRVRVREAMAKSAVDLFTRKGYANTSAAEIANGADYSERTFFRHFDRKEDVVFYDHPERILSLRAELESEGRGSAWKVIRAALVNNAHTWEADDPDFTLARIRLFYSEPPLLARYLEITVEWEDAVAEFAARELGNEPDAAIRARLVATTAIGAFRAASQAWINDPSKPLADHIEAAFDHLEAADITRGRGR